MKLNTLRTIRLTALPLALVISACQMAPQDPAAAGEEAFTTGDYPAARLHLLNAMKQDDSDNQIKLLYARTLLALGDGVGAQATLDKLSDDPKLADEARALTTKALFFKGQYEEVLKRTASLTGPHAADHAWARASSLIGLDRIDEAAAVVAQARNKDQSSLALAELDANIKLATGDVAGARRISAATLSANPNKPEALLLAGRIARMDGNEAAAQNHFTAALKANPNNSVVLNAMGDSLRQSGDVDGAREHYQRSLSLVPSNPITLISLGELELMNGNTAKALELVQSNQPAVASIPEGKRLIGLVEEQRGNNETARGMLTSYLNSVPNEPIASASLARIYRASGETEKALAAEATAAGYQGKAGTLAQVSANVRAEDRALIDKASAAMSGKQWAVADRHLTALINKPGAENAAVFNNAAMVKLQLGNRAAALPLARRAYQKAPDDPFVQDTLGWTLYINGKEPQRAATLLNQAYSQLPQNFEISWHFAQVLAKAGHTDKAREVMQRLKSSAPKKDHATIDRLVARL